jgi:hypothetical protein
MRKNVIAAITSKAGLGALILFIAAGITFVQVASLKLGTAAAMGPGYFPAILGVLFILFGVILLVEAWRRPGERVHLGPLRPVILLLGSIVLFGLIYKALGGAAAIAVLVAGSALAEQDRTLKELLVLAAAVVAMIWLIFVWALNLQLNMLPAWMIS